MNDTVRFEGMHPRNLMEAFLKKKRVSHAYLFEGPRGTGKKELALWTASALMCLQPIEEVFPCGECLNCRRIREDRHPDVVHVKAEGNTIKVDQIRFLKSEFSKSGMESAQKVFLIEDAEKMTVGAANSLLKFLEDPAGDVHAFLLTEAKNRLLPTILSRCQVVHFQSGPTKNRVSELVRKGVPENRASLFVQLTNDNQTALEWNEDEWYQTIMPHVWRWFSQIQKKDPLAFVYVQTELMIYLKEKPFQHQFFDILVLFYRELLFSHYGLSEEDVFPEYKKEIEKIAKNQTGSSIAHSLSLVLEQKRKLDNNVAIQGLLEQFVLLAM